MQRKPQISLEEKGPEDHTATVITYIRLSSSLHQKIKQSAERNCRTMAREIIYALKEKFRKEKI